MNGFSLDCYLQKNKKQKADAFYDYISTKYGQLRVFDSDPQQKNLPVLLMVPDGPCFIEHFSELIQKALLSYRVVIFDMPGFGYSFPQNNYDHSLDHGTEIIEIVLQAKKITKAIFAFSCANGFYAWRLAMQAPHYFEKLILIQTPDFPSMVPWAKRAIPAPLKIPLIGQALVHLQKFLIPKIWFKIALPQYSPLAKQYSSLSIAELKHGACNCLASVVQGCLQFDPGDFKEISVPVTLIWGDKDHSHKMTDPEKILSVLPKARVIRWSHVGHFANLEDPDRFLKILSN